MDAGAGAGGQGGRGVAQLVAGEGPAGAGGRDRPGEGGVERVRRGHVVGRASPVVLDGDREADRVTGGHRRRVGRLGDVDHGAVHDDGGVVLVVALVAFGLIGGRDDAHVGQRAAILAVRGAAHDDRERSRVVGERADLAGQDAGRDLAVLAVLGPRHTRGERVADRDVVGRAGALVPDRDRERGGVTRVDRAVVGGLGDRHVGAQDHERRVVGAGATGVGQVGGVGDRLAALGRRVGHDADANLVRGRGSGTRQGCRTELEHTALIDRPGSRRVGGVDRPGDAIDHRQRVVDRHAEGAAGSRVGDHDVEADAVAGGDLGGHRGLGDDDLRAVHDDRVAVAVVAEDGARLVRGTRGRACSGCCRS